MTKTSCYLYVTEGGPAVRLTAMKTTSSSSFRRYPMGWTASVDGLDKFDPGFMPGRSFRFVFKSGRRYERVAEIKLVSVNGERELPVHGKDAVNLGEFPQNVSIFFGPQNQRRSSALALAVHVGGVREYLA